jgi:hypothetical protein
LPACEIDVDACPLFARLLKQLRKKYRRIEQDLKKAFTDIERDYETACGGSPIQGWQGEVWKYRCGSTDMRTGRSGGFRIIAVVEKSSNPHVLYPILLYAKPEKADVSAVEVAEAVKALQHALAEPSIDALPDLIPDEDVEG